MSFLSLNDVSISYNDNIVLESINLSINKGEFIGLIGNNGSGKTSLLKILAGEIKNINNGKIIFEGDEITNLSMTKRIRKGIIYIHQFPIVFPEIEAWENFALWRSAINDNSLSIKKKQATINFLNEKLNDVGFQIPLEKKVINLSETEVQILEFSRFFLMSPKLVLIDEATSILDFSLSNKILDFLKEFTSSGGSVIFVSHRISEIKKYSDFIYVIENKKIVFYNRIEKKLDEVNRVDKLNKKTDVIDDRPLLFNLNLQVSRDSNVQISLHAKQVIGITGLDGAVYENISGYILNSLKKGKKSNGERLILGNDFAFLGKNRNTDWIFQGQSIGFNLSIVKNNKFFIESDNNLEIENDIKYYKILPPVKNMIVDELSGGNKLKTAIGRTLSQHCPIVILDEPFTGIDDDSCKALINIIFNESEMNDSAFIVLSKDYTRLLTFCNDLIAIKNDGTFNYFSSEDLKDIKTNVEEQLFN